jgi:Domain of unknown function (DUF4760)
MPAEWVTAIATVFTALVIAASAVAALMQIGHLRTGNQISAYNECRETMESADFREALAFIRNEIPELLSDPANVSAIVDSALREQYAGIRLVANLFESMGLFVKTGMMDERIACELWSGIVLNAWENLRPLTAELRKRHAPGIWINFEYMAVLSADFIEHFPDGGYPRGVRRMPMEEPARG